MPMTCYFSFNRKDFTYYTGENIEGSVYLHTTRLKKLYAAHILFEGQATVHWRARHYFIVHGRKNYYWVLHLGKDNFVSKCYEVHKGDLPPGTHKFDFCIPVPPICETSCQKSFGGNSYEVSLIIERIDSAKVTFKKPISIIQQFDLNLQSGRLLIPLSDERTARLCYLHCRSEIVFWNVTVPFGGYVPGQDITFFAEIDNKSKCKDVDGLEVSFMQTYKYTSVVPPGSTKDTKELVGFTQAGPILHSTKRVLAGSFTIPPVPPSPKSESIISITYTLLFTLRAPYCIGDSSIGFPIEIGTIPLVNSLIYPNKYFQLTDESARRFKQIKPPEFEQAVMCENTLDYSDIDEPRPIPSFMPKCPIFVNISTPNPSPDITNSATSSTLSGLLVCPSEPSTSAVRSRSGYQLEPLKYEPPKELWRTSKQIHTSLDSIPSDSLETFPEQPVASTSAAGKSSKYKKFDSPLLVEVETGVKYLNIDQEDDTQSDSPISTAHLLKKRTVPTPRLLEASNLKIIPVEIHTLGEDSKVMSIDRNDPMHSSSELHSASTDTFRTPLIEVLSAPFLSETSISAATVSTDNNDSLGLTLPNNEQPTLEEPTTDIKIINIDVNVPMTKISEMPSTSTDRYKSPSLEVPSGASTSAVTITTDNTDGSEPESPTNDSPTLEETPSGAIVINIEHIDPINRGSEMPLLEVPPTPSPCPSEESTSHNDPTRISSELPSVSSDTYKTALLEVHSAQSSCLSEASTSAPTISGDNINETEPKFSRNVSPTLDEATTGTSADTFQTPLLEVPSSSSPFLPRASTSPARKSLDNSDDSRSASPENRWGS